ncbi:MAG: alpha/beta hydrolase [Myxococcota bacterium]
MSRVPKPVKSQPKKSTTCRSEIATLPSDTPAFTAKPVPAPWLLKQTMRALGVVSPRLAASAARQLFFHPLKAPVKPEQAAVLRHGSPFHVVVRDCDVHGHTFGDGPAIFLVHGWGGHSGHMAAFIEPLVGAGFRVVVADMPAHGRSSGRLTSLIHFADSMDAMAEQFGAPHAVIAHSFGAAAATVAMARGLDVGRVAFIAPPATYRTFWARFRDGVGVSSLVFDRLVRRAELEFGVRFAEIHPETLAPRRHEPLLILHDAADREIDVGEGQALALAWPRAELTLTRGLGHLRILSDSQTVRRIVEFVSNGRQEERANPRQSVAREAVL